MDPRSDEEISENILNEDKEAFDDRENIDGSLEKNEICTENSGRSEILFIYQRVGGEIDLHGLRVAQKNFQTVDETKKSIFH